MKTLIPLAGAVALVLALPDTSAAQNGNGKGNDGARAERGDGGEKGERGRGNQERGGRGGNDGDRGRENGREQRADRDDDRRSGSPEVRQVIRQAQNRDWDGRGRGQDDDRRERDRRDRDRDRGGDRYVFDRNWDRVLITGCPPGLARKDNGCLPPGQARRIEQARYDRYDYLWDRRDDYRYRYDDGYLYRYNSGGNLLGYLPALGGALFAGNPWPAQYAYTAPPAYFNDYYRLNDRYDYRYADGVLYGADRNTNAISQVVALLTGQQFNVGQRMPSGYDVYNVPYGYRDQYVDSADRWYRYNDGYVYQVDPTTQLVQAVIQLIT
jgi:hypothetical protein